VLVATFADNGGTLTVQVNDRIRVVLAGTSWTQSSSNSDLLTTTSKPTVLPASTGCVTGQGCGSVTVFYKALKTGKAQILGNRGNCQKAATTCTTGPGAFKLNVVVMKA
jgi:predicted secreted protein